LMVAAVILVSVVVAGCCACTGSNVVPPVSVSNPTDQPFDTRVSNAGGSSGDPQMTLIWNNVNDLDLHCTTPSGDEIYFNNPTVDSGTLDVDMNAHEDDLSSSPVENIFWTPGTAPSGHYIVKVVYYASHGGPESNDYSVKVTVNGNTKVFTGTISNVDDEQVVDTFDI
jgi:uncharacterized protein YfaP (DUF2135 family)